MQIVLIKHEKLYKYKFPNENINLYWIKDVDYNDNERDLLSVERNGDYWSLVSSDVCYILNDDEIRVKNVNLAVNKIYQLRIKEHSTETVALLYVDEENDKTYTSYSVIENREFAIGRGTDQNIVLDTRSFPVLFQ